MWFGQRATVLGALLQGIDPAATYMYLDRYFKCTDQPRGFFVV
jgi:hypothetical protein